MLILPDRILAKMTRGNSDYAGSSCMLWTGSTTAGGYGQIGIGGRRPRGRLMVVHRYVFQLMYDIELPKNIDVDHACHNADKACPGGPQCVHRACFNPDHLSSATRRQNLAAGRHHLRDKTECLNGHEFTEENTRVYYYRGSRRRYCRACDRDRSVRKPAA